MSVQTHSSDKPSYEAPLAVVTLLLILYWFYQIAWLLPAALILALLCLLSKTLTRWFNLGWDKLTKTLGWVMSRVLLSLVFFLILTPIAWLSRLFRSDMLDLKNTKDSLFYEARGKVSPKDIENPW